MSSEHWLISRNKDASKKIFVATGILVFDFELFIGGRHRFGIGYEGTILHLLDYCYVTTSNRDSVNIKGLTVSQSASPLTILCVLFLSEVAYCASAQIS